MRCSPEKCPHLLREICPFGQASLPKALFAQDFAKMLGTRVVYGRILPMGDKWTKFVCRGDEGAK